MIWQRWFLLPSLLVFWSAAQAVTLTPTVIREQLSTSDTFAIAGNNGSGPRDGLTIVEAVPRFLETLHAQALDADPALNASAVAVADVQQDTALTAQTLSSRSFYSATASVVGSGIVRAAATSALLTTFYADADASFTLTASVACGGDECESFVLLSQGGTTLLDLRLTTGVEVQTISGQLIANQAYTISAFTGSIYALGGEGLRTGGGSYAFQLDIGPPGGGTPPVPEPATALLLGVGVASSLLAARRRGRQR